MSALIPKEILDALPDLYASEDGSTCYGYAKGLENELGYFSLEEIENIRGALNLPVEQDLSFEPMLLSKVMEAS